MGNPNHRLVKIHRSYTVEEIARRLGIHRNTVREWVKRGLPTCDDRRPLLILGKELVAFLKARRLKNRRPCQPGEIYCVRCRVPRPPAGGIADYEPMTATLGNLIGICPYCDSLIYRRVNRAKLDQIRGGVTVTLSEGPRHIDESSRPSVNRDFGYGRSHHDNAQR